MLLRFAANPNSPFYSRGSQALFYMVLAIGLGLSLSSSAVTTRAQTTEPTTQTSEEDTIRVSTELLLFPIRIRDQKGRAVTGIAESDLRLQDKDHATTGIYFKSGVDRVALIFALDLSGSVREVISQQREAALALFARFNDRSSVAVLHFAERAKLVVPFNNDATAASEGFILHSGNNRRTAIFDAAVAAVKAFQALPRIRSERRIVILISDGLDNASTVNAQKVVETATEERVSFYIVHLPLLEPREGRLEVRRPSKGFKELAEKTGGRYFLVGDVKSALMAKQSDLSPIFQAIEEDLKSQYLLGFYISESSRDNRKHVFSVSMKPEGVEYSVWGRGYSRTQKFMINLPPGAKKLPD
jgi:Ca-activated chloride channel homolog